MRSPLRESFFIGFVVALSWVLIHSPAQAAAKKVSGTTRFGSVISRAISYPNDVPKREMHQYVRTGDVVTSSDPDIDGAVISAFGQADRIDPKASVMGHLVVQNKNGDKSFARFEETYNFTPKEGGAWLIKGAGTFRFTGGTGKFRDIKGSADFQFEVTPGGISNWQAELKY